MRAGMRQMREQRRHGSIVVITSINAAIGLADQAVYSAAKAGVTSLVGAAAIEGGPNGIRVNAVAPGSIRTRGMNPDAGNDPSSSAMIPLRRVGQPFDLVGPTRFLLSDESQYVTGCVLTVDGGLMHVRGSHSLRLSTAGRPHCD
jgi:NAD(P)-dependent dehydrogenase (short-subunit alcohol dehydrogenase family)